MLWNAGAARIGGVGGARGLGARALIFSASPRQGGFQGETRRVRADVEGGGSPHAPGLYAGIWGGDGVTGVIRWGRASVAVHFATA